MMKVNQSNSEKKLHPRDTEGTFSAIFFWSFLRIFKNAWKRDIHQDDLYQVPKCLEAEKCGKVLETSLMNQKQSGNKVSLMKGLWSKYKYEYLFIIVPYLIAKLMKSVYEADFLSKFITYFKEQQTDITLNDVIFYNVALMGILFLYCISMGQFHKLGYEVCVKMRTAISVIIYKKTLKLSKKSLEEFSVGHIVTLMTKDVAILERCFKWFLDLIVSIMQVVVVCIMLYMKMGPISFFGIGFLVGVVGLEAIIGKYITKIRLFIDYKTDERIKLVKETLSSIKVIKMLSWENYFLNKISAIRRIEVNSMLKDAYAKSITVILGSITPDLMIYIMIISCIWLDYPINTEIVFYMINCIRVLRVLVVFIVPYSLGTIADFRGCLQRISKLLTAPEMEIRTDEYSDEPRVLLKNVTVRRDKKEILSNVSLKFEEGITTIMGPVGSGKSTLLLTILRETPYTGHLITRGTFSYAAQNPWLFPATIKENILFEESFHAQHYNRIIHMCGLLDDFQKLKDGDDTLVINDGSNLSKGQKSRINLARALYKDSEIYLLDDCLSSLDQSVQNHIIKEFNKDFFQDKVCLIVTQNKKLTRISKKIVSLEDYTVKYCENPQEDLFEGNSYDTVTMETNIVKDIYTETEAEDDVALLDQHQDIYKETQKDGNVALSVYWKYLKFGRGFFMIIFIICLFVFSQMMDSMSTKTLAKWVDTEQKILLTAKNTTTYEELERKSQYTVQLYSGLLFASVIVTLIKIYLLLDFTKVASIIINKELTTKILFSTLRFIDTHLLGSILNRFSQDLNNIDENLPINLIDMFRIISVFVGLIFIMILVEWKLLVAVSVLFVFAVVLRKIYMSAARGLKRLETSTRSPFVGHINATLDGLIQIRAHQTQRHQIEKFQSFHNTFASAYYTSFILQAVFLLNMDLLCLIFIFIIMWSFIFYFSGISAGNIGIVVVQLFSVRNHLTVCTKYITDAEILMTSVERVIEYMDEDQENRKGVILEDWPSQGLIQMENLTFSYDGYVNILNNINLLIKPKEKIGIIGRTGCGKSSLVSLILKLYDYDGRIFIDGEDIQSLSVDFLRTHIDIIPQDPIIFTDTIRNNFDPHSFYKDEDIWNIISKLQIKHLITNLCDQIDALKFSCGEKQLICLGRAMLRKNRILIMDEATANIDADTEKKLLRIIGEYFKDYTVITIAHKLESISNYDKVYMLKDGELGLVDDVVVDNKNV